MEEGVTFTKGWPGNCEGNLLAWLVLQMGSAERVAQIAYVETHHTVPRAYKASPGEFDFQFKSSCGRIREIEALSRIVMCDGSFYTVVPGDYEYTQTHLVWYHPIKTTELLDGLREVLTSAK